MSVHPLKRTRRENESSSSSGGGESADVRERLARLEERMKFVATEADIEKIHTSIEKVNTSIENVHTSIEKLNGKIDTSIANVKNWVLKGVIFGIPAVTALMIGLYKLFELL